jgi:regulator of sigma E protease
MLAQPPLWFVVIAFLCALGPLILFHELGHYWIARLFGVGAEQFSIGFGREILGWTDKRGTRWKIGWLPLGGYVRFVGDMNPASQADPDAEIAPDIRPIAFHLRPWWQRFLIVLAGPAANFVLAIVIFALLFAIGGLPRTPNIVRSVQPHSAAAVGGIKAGDRILSIADRRTESFEEMFAVIVLRPDERVLVQVQRGDRRLDIPVRIAAEQQSDRFGQTFRIGRLGVQGGDP